MDFERGWILIVYPLALVRHFFFTTNNFYSKSTTRHKIKSPITNVERVDLFRYADFRVNPSTLKEKFQGLVKIGESSFRLDEHCNQAQLVLGDKMINIENTLVYLVN